MKNDEKKAETDTGEARKRAASDARGGGASCAGDWGERRDQKERKRERKRRERDYTVT